jgi:hypothetical protein
MDSLLVLKIRSDDNYNTRLYGFIPRRINTGFSLEKYESNSGIVPGNGCPAGESVPFNMLWLRGLGEDHSFLSKPHESRNGTVLF